MMEEEEMLHCGSDVEGNGTPIFTVCNNPPMSLKVLRLHTIVNTPDLLLCHNPSSQLMNT